MENKKEYWDNGYWTKNIEDNKLDFVNDKWMDKYIDIIKADNKIALDLGCGIGQDTK